MTARCVPGESGEQQRASPMESGLAHRDMRSCNVDGSVSLFYFFTLLVSICFCFPVASFSLDCVALGSVCGNEAEYIT